METLDAFLLGYVSKDDPPRSFDWDKAAAILAERRPDRAYAGLESDLEYTCGCIWQGGSPLLDARDADSGSEYGTQDAYLASTWALPVLLVDGEEIPCWRYEVDTGWGHATRWPESALEIVGASIGGVEPAWPGGEGWDGGEGVDGGCTMEDLGTYMPRHEFRRMSCKACGAVHWEQPQRTLPAFQYCPRCGRKVERWEWR